MAAVAVCFASGLVATPAAAERVIERISPPGAIVWIEESGSRRFQAQVGDRIGPAEQLVIAGDGVVVSVRDSDARAVVQASRVRPLPAAKPSLTSRLYQRLLDAFRLNSIPGTSQSGTVCELQVAYSPALDAPILAGAPPQKLVSGERIIGLVLSTEQGAQVSGSLLDPKGRTVAHSLPVSGYWSSGPVSLSPGTYWLLLKSRQGREQRRPIEVVSALPAGAPKGNGAAADPLLLAVWLASLPGGEWRLEAASRAARHSKGDEGGAALLGALDRGYRLDRSDKLGSCIR